MTDEQYGQHLGLVNWNEPSRWYNGPMPGEDDEFEEEDDDMDRVPAFCGASDSWKEAVGPVEIDGKGIHWRPLRGGAKLMLCPLCGSHNYIGCFAPNKKMVHRCLFPMCRHAWTTELNEVKHG
jgi:hypothetical protein